MTENALAVREDFTITPEDVRKFIAPNATEKEFGLLMGVCKAHKLNPFIREVHFVKYGNAPASIITGYEVYLKRAERTGLLDGWRCWIEKDDIGEKAVIEIKRKDQSTAIRWEVYRKEFDKQQSTWKAMPTFMLKKVAIAQGFRLAFPVEVGGLPYIPEEMPESKGGGTSEALPPPPEAEIVEDVVSPDPPVSPPAEKPADVKKPSTDVKNTSNRKALEARLAEKEIDRETFKEWLDSIGWLSINDEGRRSMKDLSDAHVKYLLDKWPAATAKFGTWVDKMNATPAA